MKIATVNVNAGVIGAIAGMAIMTLPILFCPGAIAVDEEDFPIVQGVRFGQIPYEFENTFFSNERDFYRNSSVLGQLKWLLGPFTENSMARDGRAIHKLYLESQFKQMNAGPIIRTLDLPSPYQFSLRTLPPPVVVAPIEVIPAPVPVEPVAPIAPAPQQPVAPAKPVPGLW